MLAFLGMELSGEEIFSLDGSAKSLVPVVAGC